MCAACVAQGAAYLVPAYAVVKTRKWRRRRRQPAPAVVTARSTDSRPAELADA